MNSGILLTCRIAEFITSMLLYSGGYKNEDRRTSQDNMVTSWIGL